MQKSQLKFNDPAPDLELLRSNGETISLSSLWKEKTILLAFIRHFGCPQCKEELDLLVNSITDLEKAGLALVVVTQGQPDETRTFCARYSADMECLCDPDRKAFKAFGLPRGNLFQTLLSPRVWAANAQAARKGYRPELPPQGQDAMQMAGIFIIGRDGRIRLPYYYDDIADHPPIELLLKGFMSMRWDKPFEAPLVPNHNLPRSTDDMV